MEPDPEIQVEPAPKCPVEPTPWSPVPVVPVAETGDPEEAVEQVRVSTNRGEGAVRYQVPKPKRRPTRRWRHRPIWNRLQKRKPKVDEDDDELYDRPQKIRCFGMAPMRIQRFPENKPRPMKQKLPWRDSYPFRERKQGQWRTLRTLCHERLQNGPELGDIRSMFFCME